MPVPTPSWAVRNGLNAEFLDADGRYPADETTYDNGSSGLTATDVQAAIDELTGTGPTSTSGVFDERVRAFGFNLTKRGALLTQGTGGSWNEKITESPSYFYHPVAKKHCLVAVGYDAGPTHAKIGVWTADTIDDLMTPGGPVAYGSNPFFAGSGSGADSAGVSGPVVYYDYASATTFLFYIGLTSTGYEAGTKSMCVATSTDWIPGTNSGTWTRYKGIIVPTSGWRSTAIWHANIFKFGSKTYMFFNANGTDEAIGYATNPDLAADPTDWTVDDVNSPILSKGTGWESGHVGDPFVFYLTKDIICMAYYGADGSNVAQDGYAFTTVTDFPLGPGGGDWFKFPSNPILTNGTGGDIDTQYAAKPCIVVAPDRIYHLYTAIQTGLATGWQVAVAYEDLGTSQAIDFGESGDIASSAPGDTVLAGSTGEVADAGHRHAREAWGTSSDITSSAPGDSVLAGSTGKVADAGHRHAREAGSGSSTPSILLASDHAVPFTFDDILQASDGSDFLYASE